MAGRTGIGSTLSAVASTTEPADKSAYEGLTFVEVGEIASIGELGDSHADATTNLLKDGRIVHYNGSADGGGLQIVVGIEGKC